MAKVSVRRTSWLKLCPGDKGQGGRLAEVSEHVSLAEDGKTFSYFELPEYPVIPDQDDDILHVVTNADRPDKLASTFYGEPRLWWVIAVKNGWDQPATSLNPGDEITIPSPRYVRERLVR
jgi:hypothetical protein